MHTSSIHKQATSGRFIRGFSWTLRIFAAVAFFAAGAAKLAGVPMMVEVFDHIGLGQWFRIVTGVIEIIGAITLLLPATFAFSGALLAAMMFVATGVHLFVIGGSPVPAIFLMVVTATIAWLNRARFAAALRSARSA
ncbi:DoxX family protein [Xanthomonas campestris pv. trichodesmae]|uniref:DoxX family protein n=2 Tax=Xanthomonas citri TaxID=346 RepID=A0AB33CKC1_XANCI|nr:DoxX family protein [Xanthomonas citri]ASK93955.1 DoxX family protein [Xanthomonas citri pv. vignicola]MBV6783467.1 DoxX family protein [Xanthomonas campestris pv. trichodesmae]MBZ3918459.1 DoxX family protein [Xanthomonas campestris pv. trichodesmae]MBZ3925369.1 DoxX family protein [Xanthomonas citri pv. sesbaniae]